MGRCYCQSNTVFEIRQGSDIDETGTDETWLDRRKSLLSLAGTCMWSPGQKVDVLYTWHYQYDQEGALGPPAPIWFCDQNKDPIPKEIMCV